MPEPTALPIDAVLPELLTALNNHSRCLLVAQPGAGKTTRVPLALLADTPPHQRWLLLEPRRVAARLAAAYMSTSIAETVGQTVGYRVRGDSRVSRNTRLEVLTQGILTRMLQDDPTLEGVAGIIFDEFHERSLDADLGLALALDVQQGLRPDLKLLVMSATLDTSALLEVLGRETPLIDCPGQSWPVSTWYRPATKSAGRPEVDEVHQARIVREALSVHQGDMLVFLPGQGEIRRLQRQLETGLAADLELCTLHGQMPLAAQQAVLYPAAGSSRNRRRIILTTAIAESSVTVPGVRIVIDAGRERVPVFQPRSGLTRLETRSVNQASADQRRGRAGREGPGFCYRLWSPELNLASHREPEILQCDLTPLVFELARWGTDASALNWMTPPPTAAMASCRAMLQGLALLDTNGHLTSLGHQCAEWPTHPRLALMLQHASSHPDMLATACWLVAWLEERPPECELDIATALANRPQKAGKGAAGRWLQAAQQWARRLNCDLASPDMEAAPALLALIYPERIAQHQANGRFKLASGGQATLPESNALARAELLVAVELDGQSSGARIFHAIAITREVLAQVIPSSSQWQSRVYWDDKTGRMVSQQQKRLGELILASRPGSASADSAEMIQQAFLEALLEALRSKGQLPWSEADQQLLGRLRLLHRTLGDAWPDVSDAALLATMEHWLAPRLTGITRLEQIQRLPLATFVLESLTWEQQQAVSKLTPTHIKVPSGSSIAVDYGGDEPVLAVKLQEMFGQTETPTIINGQVRLLVHLLSPARRPVQVTRDLAGFWATSYFDVRKDLRGRYPRHPWPEDPLQAQATRFTKPR